MEKTQIVSNYVKHTNFDKLPIQVIDYVKAVTLDIIGMGLIASTHPIGRAITKYVKNFEGGNSTVLGSNYKASSVNAAFANGTMAHDITELDDVHRESSSHIGAIIVPVSLALAEEIGCSGKEYINAVALGYDITARVAAALNPGIMYKKNFHPTSVCGTIGACASASKLLKLDTKKVVHAFSLAAAQASGTLAWENEQLHYTKSFQTGIAARNGVTSALLSKVGYLGTVNIFEGKYNISEAFSDEGKYNPDNLIKGLGKDFEITKTGFKIYSACRILHPLIDGLLKLIEKYQIVPEEIESITGEVNNSLALVIDNNPLITHHGQYILSVASFDQEVTLKQISKERQKDKKIWNLARRVKFVGNPELPYYRNSKITIKLKNGEQYLEVVAYPKGEPENPLDQGELVEKFFKLSKLAKNMNDPKKIVSRIEKLDSIESMKSVFLCLNC